MKPTSSVEVADREITARSLKALRGFAGITAKELSDRSNIPLATLQSIEAERRPFNAFQLALLSSAMGVEPRAFIRGELREWDGRRSYDATSLGRWLIEGQYRQTKELLKELERLHTEQIDLCRTFNRDRLRLYFGFAAALFELELSGAAFERLTSGCSIEEEDEDA